jgi:DNA uptake protein ComE-like DNA-binding protein
VGRRGTILVAVLLVITIASLVGTGAMYTARAEALGASVSLRRTEARALAWSGVQGVMAELSAQREALLDGEEPRLTEEWELWEEGMVRAVVRLAPVRESGPLILSEPARLNLNSATAEMLAAAGLEQKEAEAIVAARQERPLSSVQDVMQLEGMSAARFRGLSGDEQESASPLLERFTVWSFDANTQSGLGDDGVRHRGKLRMNLGAEMSERLAAAIDDRFGEGASNAVKTLRERGTTFSSTGDIVRALNTLNIQPRDWPAVLDAFSTTDDPYIPGRIDLMRAPVEVLASIPGIDQSAAEQIVQVREGLDSEMRQSIAWPVIQGIVSPGSMAQAADHLTARSLQWRVRIEVGLASGDQGAVSTREASLRDRLLWEVVVDVASERPRVAYLRDVTMDRAARELHDAWFTGMEEVEAESDWTIESLLPRDEPRTDPGPAATPLSVFERPAEVPGLRLPGLRARENLNFGSGLRTGRGIEEESSSRGGDMGDLDWIGFESQADDLLRMGPWQLETVEDGPAAGAGVDRRLGRWTSGKQGGAR